MKLLLFTLYILTITNVSWGNDSGPSSGRKRNYSENERKNLLSNLPSPACLTEGPAYSLYQPGKSLAGVKQQDQDGLNTCYANTASLILKSHNPTMPVPSYLHLATYNVPDGDQDYEFDFGRTCSVLNKWKKDNTPLCSTEILENQPNDVQDKILKTLYDIYNKHQYTPEKVLELLSSYEDFVEKYPLPPHGNCQDKSKDLTFDDFSESKLISLLEESTFWPGEGLNITEEDEKFAKDCSQMFKDEFDQLGQIDTKVETDMDGGTYTHYSFKPDVKASHGQKFKDFFQSQKHPSNVTYFNSIVQLLDSSKSYNGTYEKIIGESTSAKQYVAFLDKMVLDAIKSVLVPSLSPVLNNDPKLKNCLAKSNFLKESYSPLMFNSLLAQCQDKSLKQWRNNYHKKFNQCTEQDQEVLSTFNSLLSLDQNIDDIKNFIAKNDKNILKQIISNNCKDYHQYKLPPTSCRYEETPADLASVLDASDWSIFKTFSDDLEKYVKKNSLKTMINLEIYLEGLAKRLNSSKPSSQIDAYLGMMRTIYNEFPKNSNLKTFSIDKFKSMALGYSKKMKEQQSNQGINVVNKLKAGHAVGVSTCTELFSEAEKAKFVNCGKHAVTATGYKCEGGRLMIELSNSWGIGCQPDDKNKDLFECQKDQDGLTNGRAWVDYNYLSDLGLGISSF